MLAESFSIEEWTNSLPWEGLVTVINKRVKTSFESQWRVLLALVLLRQELGRSVVEICAMLETDINVIYACGLDAERFYHVSPEELVRFENYLSEQVLCELVAVPGLMLVKRFVSP